MKNLFSIHNQSGSTLIAVALLTLVMGFLMSGATVLMDVYDKTSTRIETENNTLELQDALQNFIGIHKRYPCPARIDLAPDAPGFGQEDCSGIADVSGRDGLGVKIGTAPVRTLNVPDKSIIDGYGRRYIYAVTTQHTADDGSADVLNGKGAITILHSVNGREETVSSEEGYIVYALMSAGEDDRGAYDISGNEILPCDGSRIAGENCDFDDAVFKTTIVSNAIEDDDFTHKFAFVARGPAHYWYTSPWSECGTQNSGAEWSGQNRGAVTAATPVCFASYQEREVTCRDKQGNDVDDGLCDHTPIPAGFRACAIGRCAWDTRPARC